MSRSAFVCKNSVDEVFYRFATDILSEYFDNFS